MTITKNFRLNLIVRILLIALSLFGLTYLVLVSEQYLRSIYLGVLLLILIAEMIWYIERTNRDFNAFLLGLLQADFTATFNEQAKGKSFSHLYTTFNKINRKFRKISTDKEVQHLYLETMVEHVKTGIISYDPDGNVHLINQAFKDMLQKPHINNISGLNTIDRSLVKLLEAISPNETNLIKLTIRGELLQLSLHCTSFKIHDAEYRLVSFQNIKNELDAQELYSWQKLMRVLTHEIMNSVTPITSLTATLHGMVSRDIQTKEQLDKNTLKNLIEGLSAILNRSNGLQKFTESYRSLSRVPEPTFTTVNLNKLISEVVTLEKATFPHVEISIDESTDTLRIKADPELLQQVLINLIKNAAEALEHTEAPRILIELGKHGQNTAISISDNGSGMSGEVLENIFIPFYTTKTDGSGIGLPLCRQIIQQHGGTLEAWSMLDHGTKFTITL